MELRGDNFLNLTDAIGICRSFFLTRHKHLGGNGERVNSRVSLSRFSRGKGTGKSWRAPQGEIVERCRRLFENGAARQQVADAKAIYIYSNRVELLTCELYAIGRS